MLQSIAWESSGALITYGGVVTFEDVMGAIFVIHESPDYGSLRYVIHDLSRAEHIDFSGVDMTKIVAHELGARYTNPTVKVSMVTDSQEMAQMVKTFSAMTKLSVTLLPTLEGARAFSVHDS